jgi:leader peptidase (prepilin peptidase)/N-methyltransferase
MIRILGTICAGLLGLAFGSFLNVCLSRWPDGESIVQPRSHCRNCDHTLAWWENIPLVSWLALCGRCRNCRAWIGWRYLLVELAVGGLWATQIWECLPWVFSLETPAVFAAIHIESAVGQMIFCWLVVALAALDAEHLWLPDWLTYPGVAFGLCNTLLNAYLRSHVYNNDTVGSGPLHEGLSALVGILAAAGLILLIRWVYWLVRRREGIGLGDAKLMALLAAWLGLPGALLAFALGVVLGALAAVVLLALPAARRSEGGWAAQKLPLGTFLCVGGIVSSLWGQPMIAAYLRWAGF